MLAHQPWLVRAQNLRNIDPFQRDHAFVLGIELLVVLKDQFNQFVAIDQSKICLALLEMSGLGAERAQGDEQTVLAE